MEQVIELPPAAPGDRTDELVFVGTATVLLRYAGFTVLTDPNFLHRGQRAYLGWGLSTRRLTEPALALDQLPRLDAVVLSHLHGDHFDRVARAGLDRAVPILTTGPAARRLRRWGFDARAIETWSSVLLRRGDARLRVTALPGRHARGPGRLLLPAVMGSLLEFGGAGAPPLRIYLTGDTLVHDELKAVADRYPDLDLGVLHLGGTKILGALVTMDGKRGVDLLELVRPRTAVPVHYDDYGVFRSPLADFLAEVDRRDPPTTVIPVERGGTLRLPPA
jgi:L-ascorbate metabolism protein UlaG (beta-lactamase superfamily)